MQMKSQKKISYPSHDDLTTLIRRLNYRGDSYMCYGYAGAAIPALLLNEWDRFNARMKYIKVVLDLVKESTYKKLSKPVQTAIEHLKDGSIMHVEPSDIDIIDEIPAFFEAMEIHYQPECYPEWFEDGKAQTTQDVVHTIPLTIPKKLSSSGSASPIVTSDRFVGIYSLSELEVYFKTLRTILNKKKASIVLLLSSTTHSMLVGYHHGNQFWTKADICDTPILTFYSSWKLAQEISYFFTDNRISGFCTQIFALEKPLLDEVIQTWTNTREWRMIHEINETRVQLCDWNGSTLLHIAAQNGALAVVRAILKLNRTLLINKHNVSGATALHLATEERQQDVVVELLSQSASYLIVNSAGKTPIQIALLGNAFDIGMIYLRQLARDAELDGKKASIIWIEFFNLNLLDHFCLRCPQEFKLEANHLASIVKTIKTDYMARLQGALMLPARPNSASELKRVSELPRLNQESSTSPLFFNPKKRGAPLMEKFQPPKFSKPNMRGDS